MFSCCRCTNPKKHGKSSKLKDEDYEEEEESESSSSDRKSQSSKQEQDNEGKGTLINEKQEDEEIIDTTEQKPVHQQKQTGIPPHLCKVQITISAEKTDSENESDQSDSDTGQQYDEKTLIKSKKDEEDSSKQEKEEISSEKVEEEIIEEQVVLKQEVLNEDNSIDIDSNLEEEKGPIEEVAKSIDKIEEGDEEEEEDEESGGSTEEDSVKRLNREKSSEDNSQRDINGQRKSPPIEYDSEKTIKNDSSKDEELLKSLSKDDDYDKDEDAHLREAQNRDSENFDEENDDNEEEEEQTPKSDTSNSTVEESILVNNRKDKDSDLSPVHISDNKNDENENDNGDDDGDNQNSITNDNNIVNVNSENVNEDVSSLNGVPTLKSHHSKEENIPESNNPDEEEYPITDESSDVQENVEKSGGGLNIYSSVSSEVKSTIAEAIVSTVAESSIDEAIESTKSSSLQDTVFECSSTKSIDVASAGTASSSSTATDVTTIDNENLNDPRTSDSNSPPDELRKTSISNQDSNDVTLSNGDLPKSCISRRSSSKSSIRKKVNINDSTEVIPSSDLASIGDDDEVFSDSIPPKMPRGDMCAPYFMKRGSIPGNFILPEWFNNDERFYFTEQDGILEPPVTPVGRDELALRRHRLYSELLMAAQAAVDHRVHFDPLGPDIANLTPPLPPPPTSVPMCDEVKYEGIKRISGAQDCNPDLKPSTTTELERLINRLERLVERLERSVSARELEIANRTFDSVVETRRRSFELENSDIKSQLASSSSGKENTGEGKSATVLVGTKEEPISEIENNSAGSPTNLDRRIERLEHCLNHINGNFNVKTPQQEKQQHQQKLLEPSEGSLEDIPTVLDEYYYTSESQPLTLEAATNSKLLLEREKRITVSANLTAGTSSRNSILKTTTNNTQSIGREKESTIITGNMASVTGYQDIIQGPLTQYINFSNKIGGDVAKHAQLVKKAFDAQLQYVTLATQVSQPPQNKQVELLKPTSDQIAAIQDFREKNRVSTYFNHLSAISESIPALGWVCVSPTPGPHVKEMNDAGQFYTNRVLKDWKEKDSTHVEWARAWIQTLTELQKYIKQYHTTGLVWSGKGNAGTVGVPPPPPSAAGCPPPPPPPVMALGDLTLNSANDERSALFAEINQGEAITKNLKKVTADMQTHKNPTLRTGPAPFKAPQQFSSGGNQSSTAIQQQTDKTPVFTRDGKKWIIEYQKSNNNLLVENAEMNNVIYMFRCQDSTLTIKGKVNSVVLDSCRKCSILFDSVVSSIEFVNCQSMQMQALGTVPTISIDKTDGCQMYLSKDSLGVEIISSKSSEMNVLIPKDNGDYVEQPIPEQFKTFIKGKNLQTVCIESLG